jgi:drug/metabolite transporter (DMT)-like permease
MLSAVMFFAISDALAKWAGELGYNPVLIVFFRYLFGLIPMLAAISISGWRVLATRNPGGHLLRALLMCSSVSLFFWGLRYMPLAEAFVIGFTAPLFITALSWPVLGERVGPHRWAAVAAGFVGVLIVLRPSANGIRPEALLIVGAAFTYAFGALLTRKVARTEHPTAIFTYTTLISLAVSAPVAIATWQPLSGELLMGFVVLGLVGGLAHLLIIVAYYNAPAAVNAPLEYVSLIWAVIIGWVVWQEKVAPATWAGAAVIIGAGLYIVWRETRAIRASPLA